MPSRFLPIQAGTDPSQQLAMINKNFAELDAEGSKKLFYDSTGTPSISIGVQQDGTSAIKVSKPGIDVTTATGDSLAFNSTQDIFKIVKKVTIPLSIVLTGTGYAYNSASVAHGLSFMPAFNAFITIDSSIAGLAPFGSTNSMAPVVIAAGNSSGINLYGNFNVSVDATNIIFGGQVRIAGSATLLNSATVYLFQESFA